MAQHSLSERHACKLLEVDRTSYRYEPQPDRNAELREKLIELAKQKPRYGYRRLHALLGRRGWVVNHKRLERLYREAHLAVRRLKRKRLIRPAAPMTQVERPDQEWSMDFLMDGLATGRAVRALTVVDSYTRECLAIEVDTALPGERVARVLDRLIKSGRKPEVIVADHGPEFAGKVLDTWAVRNQVQLRLIDPGKPIQTAYIESFSARLRDEGLNQHG
jgi:putative transposase